MADQMFLKIDGIAGESTAVGHKDEIDIDSFSWGLSNVASPVGTGGHAAVQDFHFTMPLSKASPKLMLACATGKHIASALLTVHRQGAAARLEYLKIKLTDCLVSSYELGGSAGEAVPTDQVSLNFLKIDYMYTAPRTGQVVEVAYDIRTAIGG